MKHPASLKARLTKVESILQEQLSNILSSSSKLHFCLFGFTAIQYLPSAAAARSRLCLSPCHSHPMPTLSSSRSHHCLPSRCHSHPMPTLSSSRSCLCLPPRCHSHPMPYPQQQQAMPLPPSSSNQWLTAQT